MSDEVFNECPVCGAPFTEPNSWEHAGGDEGRLAILESALRTIRSSIPGYLKKEITAEDFALVVIGEADSAMVNKALEKSK